MTALVSDSTFDVRLSAPQLTARTGREVVASLLARLIASREATSKADLGRATGLARTTIDEGIGMLVRAGAIRVAGTQARAGRGRPADLLELAPRFGTVLVADCGASHARLAVFDLGQRLLAHRELPLHLAQGPETVLPQLAAALEDLVSETDLAAVPRTVVVGLPGPVDYRGGTLVRPPIMPGWDSYPVVAQLESALGGTCVLENDVNLRGLGEARSGAPQKGPLLYLKVGTGVGAGIVSADGTVFRGADGAAGDVGHIRVPGSDAPCACGNVGCVEAVSSGSAIGTALGLVETPEASLGDQVVELIRQRNPAALAMVRERAAHVGAVAVSLIHCLNPERLVIGGQLALASDDLLAAIRSTVYQQALPLATRNLVITRPVLGNLSGLAGALVLGIEAALEPEVIAYRTRTR